MLQRTAHARLLALAQGFPVVVVTGPRQSGKTTLVRAAFAHLPYLSLEDPDVRERAHHLLVSHKASLVLVACNFRWNPCNFRWNIGWHHPTLCRWTPDCPASHRFTETPSPPH